MIDSRIQKWGNSMALRIPAPMLRSWGIEEGQVVALSVEGGALVARPVAPRYTLDELLERCDFKQTMCTEEAAWLADGPVGLEDL